MLLLKYRNTEISNGSLNDRAIFNLLYERETTKEETMIRIEKIIGVAACVAYVCIIAGIYAYGSIEAARRDAHLQ